MIDLNNNNALTMQVAYDDTQHSYTSQNTCLICDPDTLSQKSIESLIQFTNPNISILTFKTVRELTTNIKNNISVSYVIYRIDVPSINAQEYQKFIPIHLPHAHIIVISSTLSSSDIAYLFKARADTIINPNLSFEQMKEAFLEIFKIQDNDKNSAVSHERISNRLTDRQHQVMRRILQGLSNKMIAWELGISEGTIKLHVSSILKTLNASNRTDAAIKYQSLSLTKARVNVMQENCNFQRI